MTNTDINKNSNCSFRKKPSALILFLFVASLIPGLVNAQKEKVPVVTLPGYTIRDTNFSRKDFNTWLVTTQSSFDSLFIPSDSTLRKPDFETQMVVAVKAETYNYTYKTTFQQMILQRRVLKVYFKVYKEKPDQEGFGWVSIIAIPKDKTIRRVNFYYDYMMIRSIPVVIVY